MSGFLLANWFAPGTEKDSFYLPNLSQCPTAATALTETNVMGHAKKETTCTG